MAFCDVGTALTSSKGIAFFLPGVPSEIAEDDEGLLQLLQLPDSWAVELLCVAYVEGGVEGVAERRVGGEEGVGVSERGDSCARLRRLRGAASSVHV
jgi:hypothetical protein